MNKEFKFNAEELDEDFISTLKFLEEILEDCRKYLGSSFKKVTEIDLENLKDVLIAILKAFSEGKISASKIGEVGDALEIYIHRRYKEDFPETSYPDFKEDHPLSVPLTVISYLDGADGFIIFPEDAQFFIEMLQSPPEKALDTNQKMYDFADQFDTNKRYQEGVERGLFDEW